jgi:hypothetical protein
MQILGLLGLYFDAVVWNSSRILIRIQVGNDCGIPLEFFFISMPADSENDMI